jgi:hypothetical protein
MCQFLKYLRWPTAPKLGSLTIIGKRFRSIKAQFRWIPECSKRRFNPAKSSLAEPTDAVPLRRLTLRLILVFKCIFYFFQISARIDQRRPPEPNTSLSVRPRFFEQQKRGHTPQAPLKIA